jgi:ATP-dependent Clp protease protease subunit
VSSTQEIELEEFNVFDKLLEERIIFLINEIDTETSGKIVALLFYLDLQSKTKEIKLYINSPGGTIDGFFAIYDAMQYISAPVKTICIGEACSAAADLLASGSPGKRLAHPNAQIMIHNLHGEVEGSKSEMEVQVKHLNRVNNKITELLSRHTGQSVNKISADCEKDKYMSAEEALEYGIIDKILKPKKK